MAKGKIYVIVMIIKKKQSLASDKSSMKEAFAIWTFSKN